MSVKACEEEKVGWKSRREADEVAVRRHLRRCKYRRPYCLWRPPAFTDLEAVSEGRLVLFSFSPLLFELVSERVIAE